MDLKTALKEQYHAGLAMLGECVEKCPDDLWISGSYPRQYWRIALHAGFFTQLGLGQTDAHFRQWPAAREDLSRMWREPAYLEPYELPEGTEPLSQREVLDYFEYVDALMDSTIDGLDLDTDDCGFSWYSGISKLSNVLMNLRHIQGHVGQLSELLMARAIETDWVSKASSMSDARRERMAQDMTAGQSG